MDKGGNLQPLDEPSSAKTVNLFDRQWRAIDSVARVLGKSRSELLRQAVDLFIDENEIGQAADADAA